MENSIIQDVDILEEVSKIEHSEAPKQAVFEESDEHFEAETDENTPEAVEVEPQMTTGEYRTLAKNIIKTFDGGFVSLVDNRVFFDKYCKDIPAPKLIECEKIFNEEQQYRQGTSSFITDLEGEMVSYYAQYKAYRKKIDRAKLSQDEIKSLAEPLSSVLKQKMPQMSPMNAFLLAIGMAYIPRGLEVFTEK